MEGMTLVLDISSDEEGEEEVCSEKREEGMVIEYDWVKEFLDVSDEEQSDEVVVVNEPEEPKSSKCCSISTPPVKDVDEEDEDVVILDGDPDNLVAEVDQAPTESEELVVVGEKGQIACRDYPHPRHLCGNFPFSSTPHERHCDQCHCYVCDSSAPCLKWGTGLSTTDHCHATDKSEMWKTLRKNVKLSKTAPLPASTNYGTLHDVVNLQCNHIPPLDIMSLSANSMLLNQTLRSSAMLTRPMSNLIPQNQPFQPTLMRTCSSPISSLRNQVSASTNFTIPRDANHGRCQESGSTMVRNKYLTHSFPRQLLGVHNHAIQKKRGRGAAAIGLGPQFLGSHMMSKNVGRIGSNNLRLNPSAHVSSNFSNNVNPASQYATYRAATGFLNNRTHGQNDVLVPKNVLHPQLNSELANLRHVSNYTTAYETGLYHQSNDSRNFYGSCNLQGNGAPSSYVAHLNNLNEHLIRFHNENAYGNVIKCGITTQDACQQKPHDESQIGSARKADFSAFDSSCLAENRSQSISYLQNSRSINQAPNVKGSGTKITESTSLNLVDDMMNSLFDEQDSVPVVADNDALASEMKIPSPDLSTFDTGMFLVDFDDPWNDVSFS